MSMDGRYLLHYESQPYLDPTPMRKDRDMLLKEIGCLEEEDFTSLDYGTTIYFEMPKYTLLDSVVGKLLADQVMERKDCDIWKVLR